MLNPATWLPAAQALPEGGRKRVDHDCGSGRTMIVDHKEGGWSAYCWRCSDKGFQPHPQPSLAERIERITRIKAAEQGAAADTRPPMPANFEPSSWPLAARVWLYKAGLSNEQIIANGFYYCEPLSRIVMPVVLAGIVVFWQARGFDPGRPKYINPATERPPLSARYGMGAPLVLTEDILSAIRVGEVTTAYSLLGTSMSDAVLRMAKADHLPVRVWLDPDRAGSRGRRKIVPALRAFGIDAKAIVTDRDPKFYSKEEIRELVST